jgi:hypothetical protein
MGTSPTKEAIIGQFVNGRNAQDDFLQLADNHGGTVFGWIDAAGHLQGSLLPTSVSTFVYIGPLVGIPATATVGQLAFITDATPGRNIYEATAPNVFTQQLSGILPSFGTYTMSVSGGVTSATNNVTGSVDFSGTDAAVVINAVIANMPNGGVLFFKNGIYNLNSLIQETAGGFSHYYAIGIPGGGSTQYATWSFIGESFSPAIDLFANPVQTNGVIFNVTATAITSVPAGVAIFGIWAKPDVVNNIGATVVFKNLLVRFPTNQRGSETAIDVTQALMADFEFVTADFNITWNSLAFPVAGAHGLFGITSTKSIKEQNYMKNTYAAGYDVGLDIQSEHTILINSYAINCNHAIDYGVRGGNLSHASSWLTCGWGECARGLTLGANCQPGTSLTIAGLDIEDATSVVLPAFLPVYHAKETTPGNTSGLITYNVVTAGIATLASPPYLFDGGGGTNFMIASGNGWSSAGPFTVTGAATQGVSGASVSLATDNFTRGAENPLSDGGKWTEQTGSAGALQTTGTLVEAVTTSALSFFYWNANTWPANQYSEMTVGTLTGPNFLIPSVRMDTATNSGYMLLVEGTGAVSITKFVSGAQTSLVSTAGITTTVGDVFRLTAVGPNLAAYRNGVLLLQTTNFIYTTGVAGIGIFAPTLASATSSLWSGGTFQGLTLGATTATSASAGSNGDVPAQVVGYLNFNLNGTAIKVPYYAV